MLHSREIRATISHHANVRMRQRGYTNSDLMLIRSYGSPVNDGYFFSRKDFRACQPDAAQDLQRLERLIGTALIELEGTIVTIYRADKYRRRKLTRH